MNKYYQNSGVNLIEAQKLNTKIYDAIRDKNVRDFVGCIDMDDFAIFSCCDGIGTKIIPLYQRNLYRNIAQELVAANLNDMITRNVTALGFLDYISVNKLDSDAVSAIIIELKNILQECRCTLLGGETSEMPDLIQEGKIDIAGFAVGKGNPSAPSIQSGDIIIGLKSSGIHANGFSLIRKLYSDGRLSDEEFEKSLMPTYIYYNSIRSLWPRNLIRCGVNITGGGIKSNLSRVIDLTRVELYFENIPKQPIYTHLEQLIGKEMYQVFNCGVGFCIFTSSENKNEVFDVCRTFAPFEFGRVL